MNTNNNRTQNIPESSDSYWLKSVELPAFDAVREDFNTEAVIIGGGISGITTAYLLSQQGIKVTVLEAGKILSGTTGYTTAKLTAQHGMIYDHLINKFGEEKAKLYYQANQEAVNYVQKLVQEQQIACDFQEEDAFIYADSEKDRTKLDQEYKAYQKIGIDSSYKESIPFNIETYGAIAMHRQAQFHPVKYLKSLVQEITKSGGQIFESTRVVGIKKGSHPTVETASGKRIGGRFVVVCSHFPFYDREGFYFARMHTDRSYLLAAKTKKKYPGGMYINVGKPSHSLRSAAMNGEEIVLVGGYGHSTGHKKDTLESYQSLYEFGDELLGIEDVVNRWSAQDPTTLDKVPYIGKYSKGDDNIFVATGYRKWGMSSGTLAGLLIRDMILGKENAYQEVFSPERPEQGHNFKEFVKTNTHNAKMLAKGKVEHPDKTIDDLENNEGAIVTAHGKRAGAYRDKAGNIHLVDTTCTHMGCELEWNNGERSWDCPCHGSRFTYSGQVIEGPTTEPLKVLDPEEKE